MEQFMRTMERFMNTTQPVGWARIWAAAPPLEGDPMLRQGVWYPVVSAGATRAVVEVRGQRVAVPTDFVEIRDQLPARFTVVYRAVHSANPASGTKADLGRVYAVCPASGTRVRLMGHPRNAKCPQCGFRGEIAWWETG
jgi:hypothetical protein